MNAIALIIMQTGGVIVLCIAMVTAVVLLGSWIRRNDPRCSKCKLPYHPQEIKADGICIWCKQSPWTD